MIAWLSRISLEEQSCWRKSEDRALGACVERRDIEILNMAFRIVLREIRLEAQAVVHGEPLQWLPGILGIEPDRGLAIVFQIVETWLKLSTVPPNISAKPYVPATDPVGHDCTLPTVVPLVQLKAAPLNV